MTNVSKLIVVVLGILFYSHPTSYLANNSNREEDMFKGSMDKETLLQTVYSKVFIMPVIIHYKQRAEMTTPAQYSTSDVMILEGVSQRKEKKWIICIAQQ